MQFRLCGSSSSHRWLLGAAIAVAAAGGWSALAAGCGDNLSCTACGNTPTCRWCNGKLTVTTSGLPDDYMMLGKCVEEATSCGDVHFGELEQLLTLDVPGLQSAWEVVRLDKSDPDCSLLEYPTILSSPTCDACTQSSGTWCLADIKTKSNPVVEQKGGVCLPGALGFMCDSTIVPEWPEFTAKFEATATKISTKANCLAETPDPVPPPSPKCTENLSCKNCGNSSSACTWCGLEVTFPMATGQTLSGSTAGVCVDGAAAKCDDVDFGTLERINKYTGMNILGVEPLAVGDQQCSTVQWPRLAATPTCKRCTEEKHGWCEISGKDSKNKKVSLGVCMDPTLDFLCPEEVFQTTPPTATLKWSTTPKTCKAVPKAAASLWIVTLALAWFA